MLRLSSGGLTNFPTAELFHDTIADGDEVGRRRHSAAVSLIAFLLIFAAQKRWRTGPGSRSALPSRASAHHTSVPPRTSVPAPGTDVRHGTEVARMTGFG